MHQVAVDVEQRVAVVAIDDDVTLPDLLEHRARAAAMARTPYSAATLIGSRKAVRRSSHSAAPKRAKVLPGEPVTGGNLPCLQVGQQPVAGLDDAAQQQAGHDGDGVAHAFGHLELDLRRLAAAHDVQQARPLDALGHGLDLFHGLRRLDEGHVGTVGEGRVGALDRLVETDHGTQIGPGDDAEVLRLAGSRSGADLGDEVLAAHQLLVVEMAALLGEHLVLDMDRRDAGALELLHGAEDVQLVAEAGVAVADQRDVDRIHDARALPTISLMVIRP